MRFFLAKRRKRKTKWSNFLFKRGRIRWLNLVVLVLIIALAGYGVDQLHQLRERQMIVQKQSNSKKIIHQTNCAGVPSNDERT